MSAAPRTEAQYASPLAAVIVTAIPVGNDGSAVRRAARVRPIIEQPGRGVAHNDRRPCPARGQNLVVWAKWLSPNSVINGHRPQLSRPIHCPGIMPPGIMPSWAAMPPGIMPWGRPQLAFRSLTGWRMLWNAAATSGWASVYAVIAVCRSWGVPSLLASWKACCTSGWESR